MSKNIKFNYSFKNTERSIRDAIDDMEIINCTRRFVEYYLRKDAECEFEIKYISLLHSDIEEFFELITEKAYKDADFKEMFLKVQMNGFLGIHNSSHEQIVHYIKEILDLEDWDCYKIIKKYLIEKLNYLSDKTFQDTNEKLINVKKDKIDRLIKIQNKTISKLDQIEKEIAILNSMRL